MSFNLETYYDKIIEYLKKTPQVKRSELEAIIVKTLEVKEPYKIIMKLKKRGLITEEKIIFLKEIK
jgi:hypothetical protein